MPSTTRRDFIRMASAAGAGALVGPTLDAWAAPTRDRKNVLFIAVDDLRPQLGCYGHKPMRSPHIDRIAGEGTLFERAYCQVPVCGASRASLLTGLRPTRNRFRTYHTHKDRDAPDATSLPMHFKRHGYTTLSRGKIYHHKSDDTDAWEDVWRERDWRIYLTEASQRIIDADGGGKRAGPAFEAADVPDDAYPDGRNANKLIDDLRALAKQDKPWFLAGGFAKPHLPFNCPKRYWDLYDHDAIDLADNPFRPKGAPRDAFHNWGELRAYAGIPKRGPVSDDLARDLVHGYYACVSYIDAQIGRVMAELDRLGLRDETIVVLWGDHGWNLGEHGLWCKHCNFETSLHSPLIVRAPGTKPGQRTEALVEFVDIYPSLCELAGLPTPGELQGDSFVPLLNDPAREWKPAAFSRYHAGDSVRTDRFRYTAWRDGEGNVTARMMYDHDKDPRENVNIAGASAYADDVTRMEQWLTDGWQAARPRG